MDKIKHAFRPGARSATLSSILFFLTSALCMTFVFIHWNGIDTMVTFVLIFFSVIFFSTGLMTWGWNPDDENSTMEP